MPHGIPKTDELRIQAHPELIEEFVGLKYYVMAELFDVNVPAISKHLSNIFEEGELHKESTVSKMEIAGKEYDILE